jgi:hypothetical protein
MAFGFLNAVQTNCLSWVKILKLGFVKDMVNPLLKNKNGINHALAG